MVIQAVDNDHPRTRISHEHKWSIAINCLEIDLFREILISEVESKISKPREHLASKFDSLLSEIGLSTFFFAYHNNFLEPKFSW